MPVWQVVLVLNLTLALGVGLGYAGWGRRAEALEQEVGAARAQVERLERERQACAAGARAGEQQWEGHGIVRAIYPKLFVITHESIPGLLPARTTSFRTASPKLPNEIGVGDAIRFSLWGTTAEDAALVAIERW
jgi:Copper binding periplasmic protein CusF